MKTSTIVHKTDFVNTKTVQDPRILEVVKLVVKLVVTLVVTLVVMLVMMILMIQILVTLMLIKVGGGEMG